MKNLRSSTLATVAICLLAGAAGLWYNLNNSTRQYTAPEITGFAFPEPAALSGVNLIDENENPLTEQFFSGDWTFIYVGYTFCPDACPLSLNTLSQMHKNLNDNSAGDNVKTLLVSVDPERDKPKRLKEYVKYFNENFVGATGTFENLATFAKQVSAVYSLPDDRNQKDYLVDHSSSIILINPNAEVHAIFTPPQTAELLATDFIKLKKYYTMKQS